MNKEKQSFDLPSQIISVLLHPLLMPTYGIIILLNSGTHYSYIPWQAQKILYTLIFLTTFLIPVSIIPFLMSLKLIRSIQMDEQKDRFIPLIISALSYYFGLYLINKLPFHVPLFIKLLVSGSLILILLNLLINIKWKISAHLIGIGGLLAFVFAFSIIFYTRLIDVIILLSILSGVVAVARLNLQAHNPAQVYSGFLLGFTGMLVMIYLSL
jgi:membrane-associated phospholipid phosphatase